MIQAQKHLQVSAASFLDFKTCVYFSIVLGPALNLRERKPPSYSLANLSSGVRLAQTLPETPLSGFEDHPTDSSRLPGSPTQAFVSSSPSLRSSCTRQPTARCEARCYSDRSLTSSSADPASGGSRTSTCKTAGDPETAMNSPHPGAALPAPPAT